MTRKEEKHHKKRKHKKSKHKKDKKHKHKHKKRRKKTKHHRRKRAKPSGLPSLPTLEQNQYFMMQARVAGLEQQLLAQAKTKPQRSRAEEVDLLNQVLEEQDRQSRGRDRARGDTGFTPEEARKLIKLGADLSRSAPDSFGVEHMGGDDMDSSSAERSAARSRSESPTTFHSMTPQPEPETRP